MDDKMVTSERIDDVLDKTTWANEVTKKELVGISKRKTSDTKRILGVQEPASVRKIPYRIFNMLTYTAHNPTATIEFLKDVYPERAEKGGLFDIKKGELKDPKATELYNEFGNPYQVVPRAAINYVAETLKHIHNPNFEDATRYYVQPHARVLRLNYNKFNVLCDPSVVGGPVFYRSINAPVRLVSENEITDDAMDW